MKPLRISISAFGPYLKTQTVDFTTFYDDGLFLLTGDTGAGKSTILDAMVVALFNQLPGSRKKAIIQDPLKLTFNVRPAGADDNDRTKVIFEFALGAEHYRVTREPKNVTSSGTTRAHKAAVEKLQGNTWQTVTDSLGEVDQWITENLGMDAEQFAQLVMLPQGKFDRFLRSDSEAREKILASLFPVSTYARIEEWFTKQRQRAVERTSSAESSLQAEHIRVGEVMGAADLHLDGDSIVPAIEAAILDATSVLETATTEIASATVAVQEAIARHEQAKQANAALVEYQAALADIAESDAVDQEIRQVINDDSVTAPYSSKIPALTASLHNQLRQAEEALSGLLALENLDQEISAREIGLAECKKTVEAGEKRIDEIKAQVKAARTDAQTLTNASAAVVGAQNERNRLDSTLQANNIAIQALADKGKAEEKLTNAKAAFTEAESKVAQIQASLRSDMAATLAASLIDGQMCPVCGSEDHPHPAVASASAATEEDLETAIEELESTRTHVESINLEIAGYQTTATVTLEQLNVSEPLDPQVIAADIARADAALAEAKQREIRYRDLEQVIQEHTASLERFEAETKSARDEFTTLQTQQTAAVATRAERQASLAKFGERTEIEGQCSQIQERIDVLDKALQRVTASEQKRIGAIAIRDSKSDMAKAAVSQMEPLAEAVTTAQAHESQLKAQVASADARAKRLVELKERVVSAQVAFAEAIKDQQAWDSIAKLVEGNTGAKIPLLRYYLARRLKQVTHEASKNLSHMTGGRFTLIHDETAKGNNGRVEGLAVMVKDGWDGSVRTPESLSGGEGFMASLSLALALSEIVSRETGGRKLGALFIDEGFGSLDDETLNQVMDILDGLRSGGRLVGVISHVSSMRARIPAQLVVKRGRQGSTISTRINDNPEMSA